MYKVGVIGDRGSVVGFRAVGLEVFPCQTGEEARKIIHRLAKDDFAIIYITEKIAETIPKDIDRYKDDMLPAIIPIPDRTGSTGKGMENVRKSVERAVGADILFGGDN